VEWSGVDGTERERMGAERNGKERVV